ncbi:hypothetical protein TSOC_014872, partial [Tetrabaena socialis]
MRARAPGQRLLALALTLACLASSGEALRLPSWGQLLRRRPVPSQGLLQEVLSPRSPALGLPGDRPDRPASLLDPSRATLFSAQASRRLPRLAHGPSLPLDPRPSSLRKPGDDAAASGPAALHAADPTPPDLDLSEATIAGRLASISYCSHPDLLVAWNCTRCRDVPGFTPHRVVYDAVWDLSAFVGYYAPWKAVVLSFRGTDSSNWGQWAENMRAWRTDHMYPVPDFPHALIHAGFFTLWTGSSLQ